MNKVLIKIPVIIPGSVHDSLEFLLIFFELYHLESILKELVLIDIIKDVFLELFKFLNYIVVDL